jgi:hypothetical protein
MGTDTEVTADRAAARPGRGRRWVRPTAVELLVLALVLLLVGQRTIVAALDNPALRTWSTLLVSLVIQATPFLVAGVLLAAAISAFVPASFFARALPRSPAAAVPVAGLAGVAIPGCECAAVPVAGSLVRRGVAPAAALAFLLSAPAINPIVLVSTAVAFPGQPEVVLARFLASLLTAVVVGWIWLRVGRSPWMRMPRSFAGAGVTSWEAFRRTAQHDLLHAGGYLVLGAMVAATLNVLVPPQVIDAVADRPWLAVLALALLAVVVAICSEADAFVAASLSAFPLTARLAFMVVGPAVDVKLIAMQVGIFGRAFALRFAPLTFVVAVLASVLVGGWLL